MTRKDYILIAEALQISYDEFKNAQPTSLMRNSVETNLKNVFVKRRKCTRHRQPTI